MSHGHRTTKPARTALAPPPAPPARGGEAAAGIWGGGREAAAVAPPPPPRPAAHGASLLPGFLSQPSGGSLPSPAAAGCANCVRAAARVRQVRQRGDRRLELGRLRRLRSAGLRTPRALRGSGDAGARLSSRPSRAGLCGCSVRSWRRGRRRRAAEDGARLRKRRARGGGMSVLFWGRRRLVPAPRGRTGGSHELRPGHHRLLPGRAPLPGGVRPGGGEEGLHRGEWARGGGRGGAPRWGEEAPEPGLAPSPRSRACWPRRRRRRALGTSGDGLAGKAGPSRCGPLQAWPPSRGARAAAAALGLRAGFGAALKICVFLKRGRCPAVCKALAPFQDVTVVWLWGGGLGWGGLEFLCLEPSNARPSTGGCPSALTATAAAARRAAEPGRPG